MDASEQTVFLHVKETSKSPIGTVYISGVQGKFYSPSLTGVLKGYEYVDFENVNSLEGVFIANKYVTERASNRKSKNKKGSNFDLEDMNEEGIAKVRRDQ